MVIGRGKEELTSRGEGEEMRDIGFLRMRFKRWSRMICGGCSKERFMTWDLLSSVIIVYWRRCNISLISSRN